MKAKINAGKKAAKTGREISAVSKKRLMSAIAALAAVVVGIAICIFIIIARANTASTAEKTYEIRAPDTGETIVLGFDDFLDFKSNHSCDCTAWNSTKICDEDFELKESQNLCYNKEIGQYTYPQIPCSKFTCKDGYVIEPVKE